MIGKRNLFQKSRNQFKLSVEKFLVNLINRKSQKSAICEPNDTSDFEKRKSQNDKPQQQQGKQEQNQHQQISGQQQQQQPGGKTPGDDDKKPGSNGKKSEDEAKPGEDDKQSGEKMTPENDNAPRTAYIDDVSSESSDEAGKKEPVPEDKRPAPGPTKSAPDARKPAPKPASDDQKLRPDGKKPRRDKKPEPATKPAAGDKIPRPGTKTLAGEKKPSSNRKAAADKMPVPAGQKPRSNSKSAPIKSKPASDDKKPDKKRLSVTIRAPGDQEPGSSVNPEDKILGAGTKSVIGEKKLASNVQKLDTEKKPERSTTPIPWDDRFEPPEDKKPESANQPATEEREDELFDKGRVPDSRPGNENESRPDSPDSIIKDYPRTKDNKDAGSDIKPVPGEESPTPDEESPWSDGKIPWWDIWSARGDKMPEPGDNNPGPSTKPAPDGEKSEIGSETSKEVLMPGSRKSFTRDFEKPDAGQKKHNDEGQRKG